MVFVLSSDGQPLDPTTESRARRLLSIGRATVHRTYPFTIMLSDRTRAESVVHAHQLKLDPGSKTTGLAIVQSRTERVVWAGELTHRGQAIQDALLSRRTVRQSRRQRKTRYRPARFLNRRRKEGWLPPSLNHRVLTTQTWVLRLIRLCPITALSMELVRFDTQLMENAEISGIEYQQGTLAGYELREYMLEKWGRTCAYCGKKEIPLQSGGRTKWNRTRLGLAKSHWADAACHPEGTRRINARPSCVCDFSRAADRCQRAWQPSDVWDR